MVSLTSCNHPLPYREGITFLSIFLCYFVCKYSHFVDLKKQPLSLNTENLRIIYDFPELRFTRKILLRDLYGDIEQNWINRS